MILLAIVAAIGGAIALEAYLRAGKRRPLSRIGSDGMPLKPVPLGHEAIDHAAFNKAVAANAALAAKTSAGGKRHSYTAVHSQAPVPVPDDETYAARFHRAFGKTETKT